MTKRQPKRGTEKKLKDLDPKGKAKKVTGGRSRSGSHVGRVGGHVTRAIENVGDAFDGSIRNLPR